MTAVATILDEITAGEAPLRELASLAWQAAQNAARFLHEERPDTLAIEVKSSASDMVSAMDRGAEAILVETILQARPNDGFLGEEGGERAGTSGVRWVVDPLDGTVNYLHRIPMWSVSVAAELGGEVVVGVIVAPALGERYLAVRGHGAWVVDDSGEATALTTAHCSGLDVAVVATGFGYDPRRRQVQASAVAALIGSVADIRRAGAATIDLAWTARGRLDGYFERGLNPWDVAAGLLLAKEAGASVVIVEGDDAVSGLPLVCTPSIVEDLTALLRRTGA